MSSYIYNVFIFSGNKETLLIKPKAEGCDTREALLAFHDKYYSSNLMGLSVLGKGKHPNKVQKIYVFK